MIIKIIKAIIFGIIEGITEWLPISSTGHLILLNELIPLDVSPEFYEMFQVVIQLGAIVAVIILFFNRLNPFSPSKNQAAKKRTWDLWFKVIIAVIPSAVIGFLLDDWFDEHFYNYVVVAVALIVYGIAFIYVERDRNKRAGIRDVMAIDYKTALLIGAFQMLALIPGTSRSGSTILGAILLGVSRTAAAEFSFFLAIPTMAGASLLKALKFVLGGAAMTFEYWVIMIVGCAVSFFVSLIAIRGLMNYVKKHTFSAFGVYRIALGIIVLCCFALFR